MNRRRLWRGYPVTHIMEDRSMTLLTLDGSLRALAVTAFTLSLFAAMPSAMGAGGFNSNDSDDDHPTCPKGKVFDARTKQCVEERSGVLPDDALRSEERRVG